MCFAMPQSLAYLAINGNDNDDDGDHDRDNNNENNALDRGVARSRGSLVGYSPPESPSSIITESESSMIEVGSPKESNDHNAVSVSKRKPVLKRMFIDSTPDRQSD